MNIYRSNIVTIRTTSMKLSEFQKKRSNPLLQERMLVRKKQSELKDIHKTIVHDRLKTDYETIYR